MTRTAEWCIDYVSPYPYLQMPEFADLPNDVEIKPVPVLFAGLLGHWGQLGPAEIPAKKLHTFHYSRWLADKRDAERAKKPKQKSSDEVRAEIRALMRGEDPDAAAATVRRERGDPNDTATVRSEGRKVVAPRGATKAGGRNGHELGSDGLYEAYVSARKGSGSTESVNRAGLEATPCEARKF